MVLLLHAMGLKVQSHVWHEVNFLLFFLQKKAMPAARAEALGQPGCPGKAGRPVQSGECFGFDRQVNRDNSSWV